MKYLKKFNESNNSITKNSTMRPEWIDVIVNYQTDLDSNVDEYIDVIKSSERNHLTLSELAEKIFYKIYTDRSKIKNNAFSDKELERIMKKEYIDTFCDNIIPELENITIPEDTFKLSSGGKRIIDYGDGFDD
jgi:uncharacterized protein YnzC (UPF0291/DUF896 family)